MRGVQQVVESDRSNSQSRSSSSGDKVKHHHQGVSAHYRRRPQQPDQEYSDTVKMKPDIARRISLDDLSAAFQGN